MNAAAAAPGVTALVLIVIMAVGPDLMDLMDAIDARRREKRGKHRASLLRPSFRVTSWTPPHPVVRKSAPQICDASEVTRVALEGMMVWPYREDPLTETTQGMKAAS